jgi:GNAT superfamily N-acetyltransferase
MHRELAAAWVGGWTVSRGTRPPRPTPWGLRVDVGTPRQHARYVMLESREPIVRDLVSRVRTPATWLKVLEKPEVVEPWLSREWRRDDQHWLMAVDLVAAQASPPADYRVDVEREDGVIRVTVRAADGSAAASGQVGLDVTTAVVDQVGTEPAHQRRGLGTVVLRTLANESLEAGAQTGILGATFQGRALYEALGWKAHAPLTGFVYRPPAQA